MIRRVRNFRMVRSGKRKNRGEDDDCDVNVLPQDFLYPVRKINIRPR